MLRPGRNASGLRHIEQTRPDALQKGVRRRPGQTMENRDPIVSQGSLQTSGESHNVAARSIQRLGRHL